MKKCIGFLLILILLSALPGYSGITGKISGTIVDAETGDPLPGVNVIIENTTFGAASDMRGNYVILNLPPGMYKVKVSMMGYKTTNINDVRVNIDLSTQLNINLNPEVLAGEEVSIVAERPVVQKDVAASQKNITSDELSVLPVSTVSEAMSMHAGVTSALEIRGGESNQTMFMVDGIVLRDERNNRPISAVPLSAVNEISIQTGGFNAEYQNARSGVVNVVTREGAANHYTGSVIFRYRPPSPKHFGISPYDPNSFWLRPYMDPTVCWTGTDNGVWDEYDRRQYPVFAGGWNAFADSKMKDDDPTNDLTPSAWQRLFTWEHRKQGDIADPDYNIDGGFGGPVPFIGKYLGDLRFYSSFRREESMYLLELSRKGLTTQSSLLKLNADISPAMKLVFTGLYGEIFGTSAYTSGAPDVIESAWEIASRTNRAGFTVPWRIYTNTYYSMAARYFNTVSGKLTHILSPTSYYEAQLKRTAYKYYTTPSDLRNYSNRYEIMPGYFVNEAPVGFQSQAEFAKTGIGSTNLAFGGPISTARDYSHTSSITARFDFTSQVNHANQVKTGAEIIFDNYDMTFGSYNSFLPESNTWTKFQREPIRASAYAQNKLEYKNFFATLGLIMEYSNPNGDWYEVDIFDKAFYSQNYREEDDANIPKKKAESRFDVSPRIAVSHPITENSKLYFNYGHYRQQPTSERQFRMQRSATNQLDYIGDPTIPLAKTVSYELGYDHALFNDYLLHLTAYYKDISDQEDWTRYISIDGKVNYYQLTANSYQDIRGFEVELNKLWGRWFIGNVNYEYRVETSGYFGYGQYNENPADQRQYLAQNPKQEKPRPRPRFKSYFDFRTPEDFGPKYFGLNPLSDWHFNLIARWTAGSWFTWNPNAIPGIEYNVQWNGSYAFEFKIAKVFKFGDFDLKVFTEIDNLLNLEQFSQYGFYDIHDYNYYMKSLHLPAGTGDKLGYGNIPGEDGPGDVRKEGVAFQPIEWITDVNNMTNPSLRAIYYDAGTKKYMQYQNNQWTEVSKSKMDQVLDDKAYIDMPNQTFFTFLNPRSAFFGFTLSYRFN